MSPFNKLVIVHGFSSTPKHHWYRSIKEDFSSYFDEINIPLMPCSRNPHPEYWVRTLRDIAPLPDEKTLFIGHSLGCIAVLRYLSSLDTDTVIGGTVLVSGFVDRIKNIPEVDSFVAQKLDYEKLRMRIQHKLVIYSSDDDVVPPLHTIRLSKLIESKLYCYHNCGHFTQNDGIKDFPQLKEILINNQLIPN